MVTTYAFHSQRLARCSTTTLATFLPFILLGQPTGKPLHGRTGAVDSLAQGFQARTEGPRSASTANQTCSSDSGLKDYMKARNRWTPTPPRTYTSGNKSVGESRDGKTKYVVIVSHVNGLYQKRALLYTDCGEFVGYCHHGYGGFPSSGTSTFYTYLTKGENTKGHWFKQITSGADYSPEPGDVWLYHQVSPKLVGHVRIIIDSNTYADASLGDHAPEKNSIPVWMHKHGRLPSPSLGRPCTVWRPTQEAPGNETPNFPNLTAPSAAIMESIGSEDSKIVAGQTKFLIPASTQLRTALRENAYYALSNDFDKVFRIGADGKTTLAADFTAAKEMGDIASFDVSSDGRELILLSAKDWTPYLYSIPENNDQPTSSANLRQIFSQADFERLTGHEYNPELYPRTPAILFSPRGDRFAFTVPSDQIVFEQAGDYGAVTYVAKTTAGGQVVTKVANGFPVAWSDEGTVQIEDDYTGQISAHAVYLKGGPFDGAVRKVSQFWHSVKASINKTLATRTAPAIYSIH